MAELVPTWPFVVMSEENVVLKNEEKGSSEHVILNRGRETSHIRSPRGKQRLCLVILITASRNSRPVGFRLHPAP